MPGKYPYTTPETTPKLAIKTVAMDTNAETRIGEPDCDPDCRSGDWDFGTGGDSLLPRRRRLRETRVPNVVPSAKNRRPANAATRFIIAFPQRGRYAISIHVADSLHVAVSFEICPRSADFLNSLPLTRPIAVERASELFSVASVA